VLLEKKYSDLSLSSFPDLVTSGWSVAVTVEWSDYGPES